MTLRRALVLIDMQKESKYGIEGVTEAEAACVPLIATCREAGVPVIYTRQISRPDGKGLPLGEVLDTKGAPTFYVEGTELAEVLDGIRPEPGDLVIDKQRWSAFHQTNLDLMLRGMRIDEVIIGGFVTDGCLLMSAADAYAHDYRVTLVKDISAATNAGSHKAAILMLANWVYEIEILDAAGAVDKVAGRAYTAWTPAGPDSLQFRAETLDAQFARLDADATRQEGDGND